MSGDTMRFRIGWCRAERFQMARYDAVWYQVVSTGITWCRMVWSGIAERFRWRQKKSRLWRDVEFGGWV